MASTAGSPDELLLHFVERLPTTIRSIVLARCCMAFGRLQFEPNQDLFATFRAILRSPDRAARAYKCAEILGIIELTLRGECVDTQGSLVRALAENGAYPQIDGIDLHSPLIQKHWRAAREELLFLRRDALSVDALHRMLAQVNDAAAGAGKADDGSDSNRESSGARKTP